MGGLLYKDFVAIRGKRLVLILTILTALYIILRMLFPGTAQMDGFMVTNDAGETGNIIDTFFFMGESFNIFMASYIINTLGSRLLLLDEKSKVRGYLSSMPIKKETYVASKYVFIGISAYVSFSLYEVWHVACSAFMGGGFNIDFSNLIAGFSIPLICLMLVMAAIELPMFLLMGKAKAMMVKVGIGMLIGMMVLGYLLFGDLKVFEKWDISILVKWMDSHAFTLTLLSILSPVITLVLYYLSYRLAVYLYKRKEGTDES